MHIAIFMDYGKINQIRSDNKLRILIVEDEFKLAEELKHLDTHKEKYKDKIEAFYNDFCSIEKGQSSQFIADYINNDIHENES